MPRRVVPKVVGKIDIAVEHRGGAEPRIDLNELDVHSLFGEKALLRRQIERRHRIAAAGIGNSHFGRLRSEDVFNAAQRGQKHHKHHLDEHSITPNIKPSKNLGSAKTTRIFIPP